MINLLSVISVGLLAVPTLISAVSVDSILRRDVLAVNQTTYDTLSLFGQYAASAYCPGNWGGAVGTKITCVGPLTPQSNCPMIEGDDTNIILKFAT